jgi:hypothetical protein
MVFVAIVLLLVAGGLTAFILRNSDADAGIARPTPAPVAPTNAAAPTPAPTDGPTEVPTTDPAPTEEPGDPQALAAAMADLLVDSGASRDKLNAGIDLVNRCTQLSRAVSGLQEVGRSGKPRSTPSRRWSCPHWTMADSCGRC